MFADAFSCVGEGNAVSGWVQLALRETDSKLRGEAIVGSVISCCALLPARYWRRLHAPLAGYPLLSAVVLAAAGTLLILRERERRLN